MEKNTEKRTGTCVEPLVHKQRPSVEKQWDIKNPNEKLVQKPNDTKKGS